MIPLHGRLFAQWLHYAFPHECPYPHMSGTVTNRKSNETLEPVTEDEVMQHIQSDAVRRAPSPEAGQSMWNPHEELLAPLGSSRGTSRVFLQHLMLVLILASFSAMVLKEITRLRLVVKHHKKDAPSVSYSV